MTKNKMKERKERKEGRKEKGKIEKRKKESFAKLNKFSETCVFHFPPSCRYPRSKKNKPG